MGVNKMQFAILCCKREGGREEVNIAQCLDLLSAADDLLKEGGRDGLWAEAENSTLEPYKLEMPKPQDVTVQVNQPTTTSSSEEEEPKEDGD